MGIVDGNCPGGNCPAIIDIFQNINNFGSIWQILTILSNNILILVFSVFDLINKDVTPWDSMGPMGRDPMGSHGTGQYETCMGRDGTRRKKVSHEQAWKFSIFTRIFQFLCKIFNFCPNFSPKNFNFYTKFSILLKNFHFYPKISMEKIFLRMKFSIL